MVKSTESSPNPPDNAAPKASGGPPQSTSNDAAAPNASPKTTSSPPRVMTARGSVAERKGQFLITSRRPGGMEPMGLQPLNFAFIEQTLRAAPDIDVVDTVGPKQIIGVLAAGASDAHSVLVAKMTQQKANLLHQQAQGRLIVERDHHLNLMDPAFQAPPLVAAAIPSGGPVLATVLTVLGKDNAPIKGAEVYLFGSFMPASGITDERGRVTVTLFGETVESIRSLYVKPKTDYWSFYQSHPDLDSEQENIVILRPLADWPSLQNFRQQQIFGWGQKAMRLDQVAGNYRGQGIKIGVLDSGAATSHDDLQNIHFGFDVLNKKTNPNTWNEDSIAHGSHCAGLIAGADNALGVRGFAPDAEVHVCKLFPGGQISHLIDALEYCIEQQIDVVNLSLGGLEPSDALEQQILRAKRAGVACIVAAGNSGGPVQYPASSPNVLAVSAIGSLNEFPPDSYHTQTVTPRVDANGYFAARFTCHGPEIAVCAPGVAITSSVPSNNYAVWDGTSMAAPHVTGLAALVLAHHPDFQATFKTRSAERVDRLFQIIKLSARPLSLGDARLTGFGLPDVPIALGLQAQIGASHARRATDAPAWAAAAAMGVALPPSMLATGGGFGGASAYAPGLNPALAAFPDTVQLAAAQSRFGNPWGAIGPAAGAVAGGVASHAIDPAYAAYAASHATDPAYAAYAAYMPALFGYQSGGAAMPALGPGIFPPPFGRQGW